MFLIYRYTIHETTTVSEYTVRPMVWYGIVITCLLLGPEHDDHGPIPLNSLAYSVANIKQFQDRMVLLPAIGGRH